MSEEFDKTFVDCYNFIRKRLEESKLSAENKVIVVERLKEDIEALFHDQLIEDPPSGALSEFII